MKNIFNMNKQKGSILVIVLLAIIVISLIVVDVVMFLSNINDNKSKESVVENSVSNPVVRPVDSTPLPTADSTPLPNIKNDKVIPPSVVLSDTKCNQISTKKEKEYCYADIAEEKQDIKICESLTVKEVKEYCYGGIRDYAACSKITSSFSKNLCYSNIVDYKSMNNSLVSADCDKIDAVVIKDSCYNNLAVLNKKYDICTLISKDGDKGDTISKCKFNVAVSRNECETLAMPIRDLCYSGVAFLNNDRSKCSLIQTPEYFQYCESSVE